MKTGLERLLEDPRKWLGDGRVGLVANPTTVDRDLVHAIERMHAHDQINLVLLFGPEHGLRGEAQDMVGVDDAHDNLTGLPVVSLYGKTEQSLSPSARDLDKIDVLVFDIQDIGSRYYTYAATMALCMRAAAREQKKIVVLDRPNPLGGEEVEGGGIAPGLESFVGLYPIPQRHGMTVGELARLYNDTFSIGSELEVVACDGWRRAHYFDQTGLPWILPSPNMPTLDTALVYPGMCLFEGTNISEGRGTTRPFELVGAPFIDGVRLAQALDEIELPGVHLRPCAFRPTFHKFKNEVCGGVQLHVTARSEFCSYQTGLAILNAIVQLWPHEFKWRRQAYEFRKDVPAIDLLTGNRQVRNAIDGNQGIEAILEIALSGTDVFRRGRPRALLYD